MASNDKAKEKILVHTKGGGYCWLINGEFVPLKEGNKIKVEGYKHKVAPDYQERLAKYKAIQKDANKRYDRGEIDRKTRNKIVDDAHDTYIKGKPPKMTDEEIEKNLKNVREIGKEKEDYGLGSKLYSLDPEDPDNTKLYNLQQDLKEGKITEKEFNKWKYDLDGYEEVKDRARKNAIAREEQGNTMTTWDADTANENKIERLKTNDVKQKLAKQQKDKTTKDTSIEDYKKWAKRKGYDDKDSSHIKEYLSVTRKHKK